MAFRPLPTRYPHSEPVSLAELGLTDAQLEIEAVAAAKTGVRSLERLGLEPTDDLRRQAAGDPEMVAAFVAAHRPSSGQENAVA